MPTPASLEGLPPEIRRQILATLDLESLGAAVLASPLIHRQYLSDRRYILGQSLTVTLGPVIRDACAVTKAIRLGGKRTTEQARLWLREHSAGYHNVKPDPVDDLSEDEIVSTVVFHRSVIERAVPDIFEEMLEQFAMWANKVQEKHVPASRTEITRLQRAMYRWELFALLFGVGKSDPLHNQEAGEIISADEICQSFCCIYEPWQVEEVGCFAYIMSNQWKWSGLVTAPPQRRHVNSGKTAQTKIRKQEASNGHAAELHGSWLGLTAFTVMSDIDRCLPIRTDACELLWEAWDGAMQQSCQKNRYIALGPSDRDRLQEECAPMVFVKDDAESPPVAWTTTWRELYSNLFGHFIPRKARIWCYVLWDKARFDRFDADDLLLGLIEDDWREDDPRESFFIDVGARDALRRWREAEGLDDGDSD